MMTVNQAAKQLAVSNRFVYRLCSKGLIEHYKLGRSIRITEAAIKAFLEAQKKRTRQLKIEASPGRKPSLSVLKLR